MSQNLKTKQVSNDNELKFPELGGFCTEPDLYIKKTGKPHPFGILSEQVFGPSVSYRCSCGFLKHKTLDAGQVCPKCGTLCDSTDLRLTTFGKIKTITPYIKFTKKNEIIKLIGKQNKALLDPKQSDANIALERFIVISKEKSNIRIINSIDELLPNEIFIPFKITGLFSLIFIFRYLAYILNIESVRNLFECNYIDDVVKVLPIDTRPVFKNKSKANSLFYEEINKFYISLINSNKRNQLMIPVILEDMKTWIEEISLRIKNKNTEVINADVCEYEQIASFTQYYVDLIYEWCFEKIRGKQGIIRSNVLSRTLEFSARTVVAVDPSIKPYELKVPRSTLFILWLPYFLNYIIKIIKHFSADEAYYKIATKKYYELKENKELHNIFINFLDWFCTDESNKEEISFNGITEKINIRQISWWNRQPSK